MDSKHQENHLKKYDEKSLEKLQSRTVFTDPAFGYVFKKTEKIVAALHLITNLISDKEPMKWQIRKISLALLSDTLSLKNAPITQSRQNVVALLTTISQLLSLLKIASVTEHISLMNYSIMHRELGALMSSMDTLHPETMGVGALVIPHDFFDVPVPAPSVFSVQNELRTPPPGSIFPKGQYRTPIAVKDTKSEPVSRDNLKDNRRESIIRLLKDGKILGIKEFAKEIKGCSEKTLQRELLALVESGVLKKTGERRWSVYSLV
jgi:hypothetical protein